MFQLGTAQISAKPIVLKIMFLQQLIKSIERHASTKKLGSFFLDLCGQDNMQYFISTTFLKLQEHLIYALKIVAAMHNK